MEKNKYLISFIIGQILLIIASIIDLKYYIAIKNVIVILELIYFFYIDYNKKQILTIVSSISLMTLLSIIFNTDYLDFMNCIYFLLTFLFLQNIYSEIKLKRIIFYHFSLITVFMFSLLLNLSYFSESNVILYTIFLLFPIIFSYFDKKINIFTILTMLISLISLSYSGNLLIIIFQLSILTIFLLYYLLNIKEKKQQFFLIIFFILLVIIISINNLNILYNPIKNLNFNLLNLLISIICFMPYLINTIKLLKVLFKDKKILSFNIICLIISIINVYILLVFNIIFSSFLLVLISCYTLFYLESLTENFLNKKKENLITIMALHLGYGGIEQYISSLCKMLSKKYQIEIVATYKVLDKPAFYFNDKVNIKYLINSKPNKEEFKNSLKEKKYFTSLKEGIKSLILLYRKKYLNIEYIENIKSKYIITTRDFHNKLVGEYADSTITKIATEHNFHNNNKKYIKTIVNSVNNVKYFVLVSETLKDFYKDKVNAKCIYIPNALDYIPKKKSKCQAHNLISIGRLSKEKGQLDLLEVIYLLKKDYKDIKLYLIGDGEEKKQLKKYINSHNLEKNVILTGFLSKNEIELKMLDSLIFVTTSYTESFGLAVLEACSYQIPVVAFDSADGLKTLLKNECGILISKRDKIKMKNAIIKLFEDKKYREKIAKNGYENSLNYSLDNVSKLWFNLLDKR